MASGGGTPGPDALRVQVVLVGVRAKPADRRLAVVDLCRMRRDVAQPVVDAGHRIAAERLPRRRSTRLGPRSPAAAVNPHDDGCWSVVGRGKIEIEQQGNAVDVRIFDVAKRWGDSGLGGRASYR